MQFLIDIALTLVYLCAFLLVAAWSWRFWMLYINQKFLNELNKNSILLEIKLPRDIMKSPVATEVALAALIQTGGVGHWHARNFLGNLPVHSSLEIASLEGIIHFYVRVDKKFKTLIETNFYAQYPGIEIVEVDDYTKLIRYHHLSKNTAMWGSNYALSGSWTPTNEEDGEPYKKDGKDIEVSADYLPIKTYVDYGLDQDPKEEFKTDPITPLLEFMGSIGKGEYFWYQVLVQDEGSFNDKKFPKTFFNSVSKKRYSLSDMAKARKQQIRTASWKVKGKIFKDEFGVPKIIDLYDDDGNQQFKEEKDKDGKPMMVPIKVPAKYLKTKAEIKDEMKLTPEEKDEIEAINKKISKPLVRVVIRLIYVAKSEHQKIGQQVHNILAFPKPFKGANGLSLKDPTDPYEFPWQRVHHVQWRGEEKFEQFVKREGFFPLASENKVLSDWEDLVFWASSMKARKIFRMLYEIIFHPFDRPSPTQVSVVNLEELATLWHLPGQVAGTPTLPRIDSNKGMAPPNLPQ